MCGSSGEEKGVWSLVAQVKSRDTPALGCNGSDKSDCVMTGDLGVRGEGPA